MNDRRTSSTIREENRPKRYTVLLVDDEPLVLGGLKDALRKEDFTVLTATSAREGLSVLADREVDVVVSDERMPAMRGSAFLSAVRRAYPHTVRIMLTGHADLDAAIRAINEGEVYRFLTKPCSAAALSITIRDALQIRRLAAQSARLLMKTRRQREVLSGLEKKYPGIAEVRVNDSGAFILREDDDNIDELIRRIETEIG